MQPQSEDWAARVEGIFRAAPYIQALGIGLDRVAPGEVEASMAVGPSHLQQTGVVHAGVQTTLADHCAGAAAGTLAGPGQAVLSVEFKVHLLRPAVGDRLWCHARVLKPGRQFAIVEAEVHTGDARRPTLKLLGTMTYVDATPD